MGLPIRETSLQNYLSVGPVWVITMPLSPYRWSLSRTMITMPSGLYIWSLSRTMITSPSGPYSSLSLH